MGEHKETVMIGTKEINFPENMIIIGNKDVDTYYNAALSIFTTTKHNEVMILTFKSNLAKADEVMEKIKKRFDTTVRKHEIIDAPHGKQMLFYVTQ
jgi:DNA-binding protein